MAEGGGWRSKSQGRGGWHNEASSYGNPPRGRGRRGGRGGRRERGETEFWNEDVRSTDDDGRRGRGGQYSRGGGRRGGLPPGLRGRDIGMYYAAKSKERKQQEDIQGRQVVHMDTEKERRITNLISNIRANDNIQPQPSTSYRDPFSDDVSDRSLSRERQSKRDEHTADCWDIESVSESGSDDDVEGVIENQHDDVTERGEADITAEETQIEINETDIPHICHYEPLESEFMLEFRQHTEANRAQHQRFPGGSKACSLRTNPDLDTRLQLELAQKSNNPSHQNLLKFRQKLPSYSMKNEIVEVIQGNQAVVLSGETGCGKTTQVAQFLLDSYIEEGNGSRCHIICTQPRRISAISVAERVADERGERCGEGGSVGYQIRLEARIPREQGSILYCTTGILLKRLVSDPWLGCASHVIIDEIHERDIQSDFLMIVLRDLLTQRSDLKLILMSATLNAAMFAKYFDNCPMLNIPGYTFPVKEYLLEDVIEMTRYRYNDPPLFNPRGMFRGQGGVRSNQIREERENYEVYLRNLKGVYTRKTIDVLDGMDFKEIDCDLVGTLIEHICRNKPDGAILVFMPGWEQISKVHKLLENAHYFKSGSFRLIPLHSMMPTVNQREVFQRPPPGTRKIVIATNIAETSITIDDVVYVVDCGKIKMKNYDAENNITTLQPEWVSRANAKQRRGRSGRVQPGECYHLYTGFHEQGFADYQKPEMLRTRLEELCLQIKLLKLGKILPFVSKAMEPPSIESLDAAVKTLVVLNALDANEELTPLGYHLAKMPVDPQTGKMLLFGAMFSCLSPILTIAASLSFKDAFYIPLGKEREADRRRRELSAGSMSDHIMLVNAYKGWEKAKKRGQVSHYCWENFMSNNTLQMLKNMRQQFVDLLNEVGFLTTKDGEAGTANKHSGNESIVKAVVCAGLYPNVAKLPGDLNRIRNQGKRPLKLCTASERKVELHPKSVNNVERNFPSSWFVYHLKMKTAKIYLYDTSVVSPYPLLFFGGNVSIGKMDGEDCVAVDNWIKFRASPNIAQLVKELRVEFDRVLESKISNPGVTAWDTRTPEGAVMHAIIDLITTAPSAVSFPQQHSSRNQSHSPHSNRGKMERGKRNNPNYINLS